MELSDQIQVFSQEEFSSSSSFRTDSEFRLDNESEHTLNDHGHHTLGEGNVCPTFLSNSHRTP